MTLSTDEFFGRWREWGIPLLAALSYSLSSLLMTFTNKVVLSLYEFNFPFCVLLLQTVFTLGITLLLKTTKTVPVEDWNWNIAKNWAPVNLLFVAMLGTAQISLGYLSVAMVTIFKNFTTIAIALGEAMIFGATIPSGVAISLFIMFFGGTFAGLNDLEFNFWGYLFMFANCCAQTCYVLYMKTLLNKLDHFTAIYYNNALSIPTILTLVIFYEDTSTILQSSAWDYPSFPYVLLASAVLAFFISLTTFWAMTATSATTYSVVGSLNKIPLTVLGSWMFNTKFNNMGLGSVVIALGGGVLYSYTKAKQAASAPPRSPPASQETKETV